MKKKYLCAALLISALFLFAKPAVAATIEELQAQIQALLAQIAALQAQQNDQPFVRIITPNGGEQYLLDPAKYIPVQWTWSPNAAYHFDYILAPQPGTPLIPPPAPGQSVLAYSEAFGGYLMGGGQYNYPPTTVIDEIPREEGLLAGEYKLKVYISTSTNLTHPSRAIAWDESDAPFTLVDLSATSTPWELDVIDTDATAPIDGNEARAKYAIEFSVTANDLDIYIEKSAARDSVPDGSDGVEYVIENGSGSVYSTSTAIVTGSLIKQGSSSGDMAGDTSTHYKIAKGATVAFTLQVAFDNSGAPPAGAGSYRVRVRGISFDGNGSGTTADLRVITSSLQPFATPLVFVDDEDSGGTGSTLPNAYAPKGYHDTLTCTVIEGWACDGDDYSKPVEVYLRDGKDGPIIARAMANLTREAAVGTACGGNRAHGFRITTPASIKDSIKSVIYAYARDLNTTGDDSTYRESQYPSTLLGASPRTITCSSTATTTSSFQIMSPNGGETWIKGTQDKITWANYGTALTGKVDLILKSATDSGYLDVILQQGGTNDGTQTITVPDVPVGSYKIYGRSVAGSTIYEDTSNSAFSIIAPTAPKVTETSSKGADPNELFAGETGYIVGSGFLSENSVLIGGQTLKGTLVGTAGQNLTFFVPSSLSAGSYTLSVKNANGTSNSVTVSVKTPTVTTPIAPKGTHDTASCTVIEGWACDPNDYTKPVWIHFYKDGAYGNGGTYIGATLANLTREAAVGTACGGGTSAHGFRFSTPASVKDGVSHAIYAHAIDLEGKAGNPLLAATPRSITCGAATTVSTVPDENLLKQLASTLIAAQELLKGLAR